jgi:Methyltransferase domain
MATLVTVPGPSGVNLTLDLDDPKSLEEYKTLVAKPPPAVPLRLDLGCGKAKKKGFTGVDSIPFDGVDVVTDLGSGTWPWADGTVDEVHCSHMIEHLTWPQRVHFFNELFRVMKKGAKAQIILPHWASARYYGDPTHQAPFSEFAWFYLQKAWRDVNAPHTAYTCDFDVTYGYTLHPALTGRSQEYVNYALQWFTEARQDMVATAVKR